MGLCRHRSVLFVAGLLIAVTACGYRPLYGGEGPAHLHVRLVRSLVADPMASEEVLSGAREELARLGALEPGDGYPRLDVEVLRAEHTSEGIAATGGAPFARATAIGVLARAWVVPVEGAARESDTGDMRAEDVAAVEERSAAGAGLSTPDALAASFHGADALRASARRLGRRLVRKVAGLPAASEDIREGP